MATAKPKPVATPAAVDSESRSDYHHLVEICSAIEEAHKLAVDFLHIGGDASRPVAAVRQAVANIFLVAARRPSQSWLRLSWPLLAELGKLANQLNGLGLHVLNELQPWPPNAIAERLPAVADTALLVINPPPPPQPRTREIESPRELEQQRVSPNQCAKIYSLPDVQAYRRFVEEHGENYRPVVELPPIRDTRFPDSRPICAGAVCDFGLLIEKLAANRELHEVAATEEEDLAVA